MKSSQYAYNHATTKWRAGVKIPRILKIGTNWGKPVLLQYLNSSRQIQPGKLLEWWKANMNAWNRQISTFQAWGRIIAHRLEPINSTWWRPISFSRPEGQLWNTSTKLQYSNTLASWHHLSEYRHLREFLTRAGSLISKDMMEYGKIPRAKNWGVS